MQKINISPMVIVFLLTALILLPVCQQSAAADDSVKGKHIPNLTIAYQGEDKTIGLDQILELEEVVREISPEPRDGEKVTVYKVKGILLENIFQDFFQVSLEDIHAINLIAGDGFSIEVDKKILNTKEIILAYEIDGQSISEQDKPFRSVIADVFEMYWVKNLVKIEIIESG